MSPLIPWFGALLALTDAFVNLGSAAPAGGTGNSMWQILASVIRVQTLWANFFVSWEYLRNYIGLPVLLLAGASVAFFPVHRPRAACFLFLIWLSMTFALLNFTLFVYSRYLLFA